MRKLLFVSIMILTAIISHSQSTQLDPNLTQKTWTSGETRIINGFHVSCIENTDYGNSRNAALGMITSVAYKEPHELEFYITRYEQSLANLKWYMIIIRDRDDKEKIFEKKLEYQAPELPNGNFYWNYTNIKLPENIQPPFYVYIRDRNIQMLYSTKFLVEK